MKRRTLAVLGIAAALMTPAATALAQYTQPTRQPTVNPTQSPTSTVLPTRTQRGDVDGELGVTGADVAGIAALGVGSIATGSALVFRARRRRGAQP